MQIVTTWKPFMLPTHTIWLLSKHLALITKERPIGVSGAPPQQYFMYLVLLFSLLHFCSMFCHRPLILSQLHALDLCKDCALQIWIQYSLFRDMKASSSYLTVLSGPSKILPWPRFPQFVNLFLLWEFTMLYQKGSFIQSVKFLFFTANNKIASFLQTWMAISIEFSHIKHAQLGKHNWSGKPDQSQT